jgi:transcriptional regulator with XRE-family HTH domain
VNIQKKIGAKVKSERLKRGLSQESLAGLAEIDRTYMPTIEKGERNISILVLYRICKALGMSVSEFLKDIKL